MKRQKNRRPRCLLIAGPNGPGKTTFAREYLPNDAQVLNFVNADLIASGLSPLRPELAAVAAARLMLEEMERFASRRADLAWESPLSGLAHQHEPPRKLLG
jgi:predicted ABC-type ATPase